MTEPVLIVKGFRNDGIASPTPVTVTQWPKNTRPPSYQYATDDIINAMGDDETAVWLATWNSHVYELVRPMTEVEVSHALQDEMAEVPF